MGRLDGRVSKARYMECLIFPCHQGRDSGELRTCQDGRWPNRRNQAAINRWAVVPGFSGRTQAGLYLLFETQLLL